jgi:AraC family transcriptional regulator
VSLLISPEDLPKWVPGKVLAASDALGWKDVGLRTYRYRGQDVQVPALDHFMIVRYCVGTTHMERRFDGRWTRTHCAPGDLSLLTRSQGSHWHWTDDIDVSHVYLSDALVSRVASDVLGRSVAEVRLHDLLRTQDATLTAIVDAIAHEASETAIGGALYAEALGTQLAVHLLRHYACVTFREPAAGARLSRGQQRRVAEYIDARLHETITLEELARVAGLGVWTFSRHFRAATGRAPHAFVIDRRIERARQLLLEGALAVKEVASSCGFADQAHLTRVLHARLGTTPAQLRRTTPQR